MRPLSPYSTPDPCFPRMADSGSTMISEIRSVHPSSDPPCAGNGQFRAAEARAATLGMEGRERTES